MMPIGQKSVPLTGSQGDIDLGFLLEFISPLKLGDRVRRAVYADFLEEINTRETLAIASLIRSLHLNHLGHYHRYIPPTSPPMPKLKCPGCRMAKLEKALYNRQKAYRAIRNVFYIVRGEL